MGSLNDSLMETAINVAKDGSLPWESFRGKTIVVTGATGLVCSQLVRVFLARNNSFSLGSKLILPVRNIEKAKVMFNGYSGIKFIKWELGLPLEGIDEADFFVHGACGTSSKAFQQNPASTISQIVSGGEATLSVAAELGVEKYVFLSTMEVYGEVEGVASEDNLGKLDPMVVRNSYPEAKRLVECLCASAYSECGVPAVVLRLAQTFGQGVPQNDGRVFAEFGRQALKGENIVLLSDGLKKNSYLSVNDASRAIITSLAQGKPGEAYNAANEDSYCSIKEMAEMVLEQFGASNTKVVREFDAAREATFRKSSDLKLDTTKIKSLGWVPQDSLLDMYSAMIRVWGYEADE